MREYEQGEPKATTFLLAGRKQGSFQSRVGGGYHARRNQARRWKKNDGTGTLGPGEKENKEEALFTTVGPAEDEIGEALGMN